MIERVPIEQAIARGASDDDAARIVGCRPAEVAAVRAWMDRILDEDDAPLTEGHKGGPPPSAKCGTRSGYARHRRAGEQACEDCLAAERGRAKRGRRAS